MAIGDELLALDLSGGVLNGEGESMLRAALPVSLLPEWVIRLLQDWGLAGESFELSREDDQSGKGVDMRWQDAQDMVFEATDAYPGIVAIKEGYLPIGTCMKGSGDPYFLRVTDTIETSPVVRIYHDAIVNGSLHETAVNVVSTNLEEFFRRANV